MTNPYRAMCAELVDAILTPNPYNWEDSLHDSANRARALLAQPVAEGPTDEELLDIARATDLVYYMGKGSGFASPYIEGTDIAAEVLAFACAAIARWGRLTPQPEEADIHYAWELHDGAGDWQAGGSANSLEDVQREGNRYLQTYSQDGPHKLIIQRHCVTTIEEATNAQ